MSISRIHNPVRETYQRAAEMLSAGNLVSFPTETVYGLGANAMDNKAVAKIYVAKNRPDFNPLIIHVSDKIKAAGFVRMNETSKKLAKAFWPGPFTMVLPKLDECGLSELVSAGLDTVAIRVPEHEVAHTLLEIFDGPIAAPSANISGRISPTTAIHVDGEFGDELQMIIDGGPCDKGIESTIVQVEGDQVMLLRPGNITLEDIESVIGSNVVIGGKSDTPNAPGQLESHYAPNAKMRLNVVNPRQDECLLAFGDIQGHTGFNLSETGDLTEAAANLFSMMRELDSQDCETIAVSPIPQTGLGLAINDRLKRAAAPKD